MTHSRPSRAVVYLRQSTFREESISLELQEEACRTYARKQGYDVVAVESDPGLSGRTFNRPGVSAVMDAVQRGVADVILLWKWSRLSRNRLDWYVAADRTQQAGGRIESATEPIDTSTSIGRLSRGMMIEIAAFESERAGDQWREAQERRVRNGLPHSGKPRFGYLYEDKAYRPDPATAPILADLYSRYIGGAAFGSLVTWLASRQVPPVLARQWSVSSVKRTLDTGFAAGIITYRGEQYPGAHEPVIDEATWAAYQQARERRRNRPRAERSQYLLSGLVRCKTCDLAMSGWTHPKAGIVYYKCDRAVSTRIHVPHHARADAIEAEVLRVVHAVADDAAALMDPGTPEQHDTDLTALQGTVDKARRALATLTVRSVDGSISDDAYRAAAPTLQARLDAAQDALRAATAAPALPAVAADTAVRLLEDWDLLPVTARREGIRALVTGITVDFTNGKDVQVTPHPDLVLR